MNGLGTFLAMGGYGVFVWPSFGIAVLALGGLLAESLHRLRRERARLREIQGVGTDSDHAS